MANWTDEAWVTAVVGNEAVPHALVLAQSIRRSCTSKQIAAITSLKVSPENRHRLHQFFDAVYLMEDSIPTNHSTDGRMEETKAKVFLFSLVSYKKCVYVSANTLFLENADSLFDGTYNFNSRVHQHNRSLNLSVFTITPSKSIWMQLREVVAQNKQNITEDYLSNWLANQNAVLSTGATMDEMIVDFYIDSGKLKCNRIYAPVVHLLIEKPNTYFTVDQFLHLKLEFGLFGKLIRNKWLETHNKFVLSSSKICVESMGVAHSNQTKEPIAIVGMSCRYPGANNVKEFWDLLYSGTDGIREPPIFRWTKEHALCVTQHDKKSKAGFLNVPVDEFDASFFNLSPKETAYMDPQTRLLHEVLWESLEDAGINPQKLNGSHTGVFIGSWMNDYKDILLSSPEKDFFRTYMGNSIGATAARLSFLLGLTGPCIATESGCSSAIVALDLAVKSLRNGETTMAFAGGVNLLLHPFSNSSMEYVISSDGRCKTFDHKADGFGRAEGCGVLVLKRLSDARRDRDNILALISGSAVSQEGLSRSLGTPTVHGEALAMQLALKDANVSPEQVSFVETHGTGTRVGDPMEVAAIEKAYYSLKRKEPLVIGSVKTNVGHTESCSGITGIMKAVLALKHELIPKHLNLETLNPEICLDSIPALIPMENLAWPKVPGKPRICGVSSFGITGTDGHVILKEAPDYDLPRVNLGLERPTHIITFSGKSKKALDELLKEYEDLFSKQTEKPDRPFTDVAYTANVGRAAFDNRAFIVASNYQDALMTLTENNIMREESEGQTNLPICFLFTGQGSQYQGMGKMLYETSPIFRMNLDLCDMMLKERYTISICEVLWNSEPGSKELSRTIYSQTSIFCLEYCLLKLWESWGIKPDYVLGHSLGEFCAAVAAGALDFEDALTLVAERSRLIDNLPQGSMLVVKASKPEVEKWMKAAKIDLDIAAVNYAKQTVVAGNTETVEAFLNFLKDQGTKAIILEASHAFHSRHMDPMLQQYKKVAQSIKYRQSTGNTKYISGVTGRIIDDIFELGADYWVRHTREKVSFLDACNALRQIGCHNFVEIGPQPVLSSFVMQNIEDATLNCLPSLRKGTTDWDTILTSLGKLYLLGYQVDWKAFDQHYIRKRVSIPFHPFHRKSHWLECTSYISSIIHPLIGSRHGNASALHIFQNDLSLKTTPYLQDHCIGNRIVFPAAGLLEMSLSAGYCVANGLTEFVELPTRAMRIENLMIGAPLELKNDKTCRLQTIVELLENSGEFRVKIFHQNTRSGEEWGKWIQHASSTFYPVANIKNCMNLWNPNRVAEIISKSEPLPLEANYKRVYEAGLRQGESFRMLQRYWAVKQNNCKSDCDEIVAEMALPQDANKYLVHPLIIDALFQTGALTRHRENSTTKLKVPVRIGKFTLFTGIDSNLVASLYLHVWQENDKHFCFVSTCNNTLVALAEDIEFLDTTVSTIESVLELQSSTLPDMWEETWKVIPGPGNSLMPSEKEFISPFLDADFVKETNLLGKSTSTEEKLYAENNRLIYFCILNVCQELGWKPEIGQILNITSFCCDLGIQPQHEKLVRFYFTVFQDVGLFKYMSDSNIEEEWLVVNTAPQNEQVKSEMNMLISYLKSTELNSLTIIHENIAKNLSKVLTGQISALTLLFPTDENDYMYSADAYYKHHSARNKMANLGRLVVTTAFKASEAMGNDINGSQRVYKVLEIGAGTGSLTRPLLGWLQDVAGEMFELYYTDISQAFFVKAEQKFEDFRQNMKFEVFNVEQSPLHQGIPLEYFDLVCATDVLHATKNLKETLVHLRQTLKPGGILCFSETIIPAWDITFVFGLLEGYWRFEDFNWRPHHCCVGEQVWESLMHKTGYKDFSSYNACVDQYAWLVAVANPEVQMDTMTVESIYSNKSDDLEAWIIFADEINTELYLLVADALIASGDKVILVQRVGACNFSNMVLRKGIELVFVEVQENNISQLESLLEVAHGVVYAWGLNSYETNQENVAMPFLQIAKILAEQSQPPQLFIITPGVHAVMEYQVNNNPTSSTLFGMAKSLKNEKFDMLVRCIDIDSKSPSNELARQILYEIAKCRGPKEQHRVQVAYRNQVRYEPRVRRIQIQKQYDELKLPPSTDRYHLKLPDSKLIQDLKFEPIEEQDVGENEVEIKIKAYALNFRDVFAILKPSTEFEKLNGVGLDFAGVVVKAGPTAKWKIGERVFGFNYKDEQLPSHYVLDSNYVTSIPEHITYWEAATLPAVFCTAIYCLIKVAKMKKRDTVLIHTGSGGVGLAAIQIAKIIGANIITTAGSTRKRTYLRNLGIQHVFHSRDTSFEPNILKVTNGLGVDIVLNSITGPGIKEASLRATAINGKFVEMSKLSIWSPEEVKILRPDVEYTIVDITNLEKEREEIFDRMLGYLKNGKIQPIPFVKFDALHIRRALQFLQQAKHIGKVVVAMPEVGTFEGRYQTIVPLFNGDSTYLITGGLGGIGFEVCKWMLELGATNIFLIGRNPPVPEIVKQIDKLQQNGLSVEIRQVDIGHIDQCRALVEEIQSTGKTLRGIMHCAGVLRDSLYQNMTWDAFQDTFQAKVNGTWNLHNCTKNLPLEHFVVYSSITALLGTPGQANHAAANCFEDAFVHYRHSLGLPGLSINWGQWAQAGCAKDVYTPCLSPVSVTRMLNGLAVALRTDKKQIAIAEFPSILALTAMWPIAKYYLDDKVLKQQGYMQGENNLDVKAEQFWEEMDKATTKAEKMNVLSHYLKIVLRMALRMDPDEKITDTMDMQQLGVDSLMKIELKNSMQTLLGSRVKITASLLENCNTIQSISEAIVNKIMEDNGDEIDNPLEPLPSQELLELLKKDSQLPEFVNISSETAFAVKPSQIQVVLCTGATGQLGPCLLTSIFQISKSVKKVYCLIKDAQDENSAMKRFQAHLKNMDLQDKLDISKVGCISGNLVLDNLGILPEKYEKLCKQVDAVIHCGAQTNLEEHLRDNTNKEFKTDCRSVNIIGTVNVLKFACTGKIKHVFYPSTMISGIFSKQESDHLPDEWPEEEILKTIIEREFPGLQTSKWVCEMLIKQAINRGIPCKVFRFPWLAGESKTGNMNVVKNLYAHQLLTFLKVGAIPDVLLLAASLPIDLSADLALKLFLNDATPNEIFNVVHPMPQLEQDFVQLVNQEFGKELDVLRWNLFEDKLTQSEAITQETKSLFGNTRTISKYFSYTESFAKYFRTTSGDYFANEKGCKFLPNYGEEFQTSMEIASKSMKFIKNEGYLTHFGISTDFEQLSLATCQSNEM